MFGRKKKEEDYLSEDERIEREIKKDLFWKALLIYGFILMYILALFHQWGWDNQYVVAFLFGGYVFLIIVTPHWVYDKVKMYYGIFSKKLRHKNEIYTEEEKSKAMTVYNAILFIFLSFAAYLLARTANYFLFHKNRVTLYLLIVAFDLVALYLSFKITKSKAGD